jgi:hypothetical protein
MSIFACLRTSISISICTIAPLPQSISICLMSHHTSSSISHFIALTVLTFIQTSYALSIFNTCIKSNILFAYNRA